MQELLWINSLRLQSLLDPAFKVFLKTYWIGKVNGCSFITQTFPLNRTVLNSNLASPEVWTGSNLNICSTHSLSIQIATENTDTSRCCLTFLKLSLIPLAFATTKRKMTGYPTELKLGWRKKRVVEASCSFP